MAKIRFKCGCGKSLAVDEEHAGKVAKCPGCERPVRVPDVHNAPEPGEIVLPKAGKAGPSLRDAYGDAIEAQSRRTRTQAALAEYSRKARKRNLIIAASAVGVLLVAFISYKVLTRRIPVPRDGCPEATWPFLDGLIEDDPRERAAAAWEAADAGGRQIASVIGQVTEDDDPLVAVTAVRCLGRIDKEGAEHVLAPLLEGENLDVRMTAAFVMARCSATDGGPGDLAAWVGRALQGDKRWAAWFEEASGANTSKGERERIASYLDQMRRSSTPSKRAMAAWMIAATLGPDQMILPLLRDPEAEVVVSSINALAPFFTAEAFRRLEQGKDPESAVRDRLALLNNVGQRLHHDDPRIRRAAALALAANGQDASSRTFRRALNDDDWFVRFAALKGLSLLSPRLARQTVRTAAAEDIHRDNASWTERVNRRIEERAREGRPESEEKPEEESDEDELQEDDLQDEEAEGESDA